MVGLRVLDIQSCKCKASKNLDALSDVLNIARAVARLQFFYSQIYPDLAAQKMMDYRDLEAVPILLSYQDSDADHLWERLSRIHRMYTHVQQEEEHSPHLL